MTVAILHRVSIRCDECGLSELFDVSARRAGIADARKEAHRQGWRGSYWPTDEPHRRHVDLCPKCSAAAGLPLPSSAS